MTGKRKGFWRGFGRVLVGLVRVLALQWIRSKYRNGTGGSNGPNRPR